MMSSERKTSRSDDIDQEAERGGCSMREKQLSFALLVVLLFHFNVFSFVHTPSPGMLGVGGGTVGGDYEDLDTAGSNWMAITDPEMLKCTNLDGLIKKRGDVVEDEKTLWAQLGCEEKLKGLYTMWQQNADETKDKCERLRESAGIEVGVDWGFASSSEKRRWKDYMCDCHYTAGWSDSCLQGKPPTVHSTTTAAGIAQAVAAREPREKLSRRPGAPKPASIVNTLASEIVRGRFGPAPTTSSNGNPVIAITLGTTSRGFRWSKLEESPLVRILLASMARTLEQGFDYRIYVGFDAGDLFYDDEARRDELAQWVENTLVRSAAARGINASFASLRFLNVLRKPGPIFNFLTAAAFADGADFVYRINDDTEFRTPFASALTTALANFKPPYLGVVGPSCADGNKKILTHDFVHRTHYHIFQTYYPVVLTDWWMDDWISKVYPRGNYGRHQDVAVSHHTWMTGSGNPVRYEVDHGHKKYLNTELRRGAQLIGQFSQSHCRGGVCQQPDGHVTPAWSGVYDPKNQTVFDSVMEEDLHRREKEAWDEQDEYAGSRYGYGDRGGEGENQWMETDRDRKGGTAISTSSFDEMEDSSRSNSADKADSQAKAIADGDGKQDADPTDVHIDRPVINHDELNAAAGWDGNWGAGDESGSPSTDGEAENSVEKEFHDVEDCRAKTKCSSLDECARLCGTGGVDVVEGDHHVWKKTEQHVKREEGKTMAMQHRIDKLDSMVAEELHDVFVPRGRDDSPPWGAGASSSDSADHIAEEQKRKQLVGSSTAGSPRGGLDGAGNKETGVGKKGRESSMSKESEGSVQDKIAELERLRAELSQRLEKARDERQKNWENLWESAEAEVEGETAKQQEGGGRGSSASAAFNPDDDDDDWGAAATTTIGAPLSLKQLDKATLSSSKSSKTGGKKRRRQKLKGRSKGDSLSDSAADKLHRQQRGREAAGKGASGSSDPRMLKEKALLDIMQRESDAQSTSARPASAIATQV